MRGYAQMNTVVTDFQPDYIITPGDVLEEHLEVYGIKKKDFAEQCGRTAKLISEIIAGKASITPETALQFEKVLGVPAKFWTTIESKYRLRLAEKEEKEELEKYSGILSTNDLSFYKDLVKLGFINEARANKDKLYNLMRFFAVGSVDALDNRLSSSASLFRKAKGYESNPYALSAWLRCGEVKAREIDTAPYNAELFKESLLQIRKLTTETIENAWPKIVLLCANAGVALVLVPSLNKSAVNGVARWLTKDKALIQLSARHLRSDILWFSFFHEAGHILLHSKKEIHVDEDASHENNSVLEQEADSFAQKMLIPADKWEYFAHKQLGYSSYELIEEFAKSINIDPSIVIGRLTREPEAMKFAKKYLSYIKKFEWDTTKTRLLDKG